MAALQRTVGNRAVTALLDSRTGAPLDALTQQDMEARFGHAFGDVRIHADSAAADSARDMHAAAYTVGRDIVFAAGRYDPFSAVGRRLLAHELAHVVQQDRGPSGESNTAGLEASAQGAAAAAGRGTGAIAALGASGLAIACAEETAQIHRSVAAGEADTTGATLMRAVADVLQHGRLTMAAGLDPIYLEMLRNLNAAKTGVDERQPVSPRDRLERLDRALTQLAPAFASFQSDPERKQWFHDQIDRYARELRSDLDYQVATERVQAINGKGGERLAEAADARAQGAALHAKIHSLVETLVLLNEQALRLGHKFHAAGHGTPHEHLPAQVESSWADPLRLIAELQTVLYIVDGALILTDEELHKELQERKGFWHGAASYTEVVKAATEIVGGVMPATFWFGSAVASASGQLEWAGKAAGYASKSLHILGSVIAGIEIAHGMSVLLDKNAPDEKKDEAIGEVAVGAAYFISGATGSIAALITYHELKLMAQLYGEARVGGTAVWMNNAFETMLNSAQSISGHAKDLAGAGLLLSEEKRPDQQAALGRVQQTATIDVVNAVNEFLEQCEPAGLPYIEKPGAYVTLRRQFGQLPALRGAQTPEVAAAVALAVLKKIDWCLEHRQELLLEEAGYGEKKDEAKPESPAHGGSPALGR